MSGDDDTGAQNTGDGSAGQDNAPPASDNEPIPTPDKAASTGDVSGGDKGDDTKGGRAGERIEELVTSNKQLAEENDDLKVRMEALEAAIASGGNADQSKSQASSDDNPAIQELKALGYSDAQIKAAKLVYQSVAGSNESELKKEVEKLQKQIAGNEDQAELNTAIKEAKKLYDVDVTQEEIEAQRKKWLSSKNPREQVLSDAPYSYIIQLMKAKEIAGKEVDNAVKDDGSNPPAVPKGKEGADDKQPTSTRTKYDPGNPRAGMDAIERKVLAKMGVDDE